MRILSHESWNAISIFVSNFGQDFSGKVPAIKVWQGTKSDSQGSPRAANLNWQHPRNLQDFGALGKFCWLELKDR